jgi:hypothetical protein
MSSAAGAEVPDLDPDGLGMIALFDQEGLVMVSLPYKGNDPSGALASLLARWQGFGSCITAGSVFDQEGQTLAHAQI